MLHCFGEKCGERKRKSWKGGIERNCFSHCFVCGLWEDVETGGTGGRGTGGRGGRLPALGRGTGRLFHGFRLCVVRRCRSTWVSTSLLFPGPKLCLETVSCIHSPLLGKPRGPAEPSAGSGLDWSLRLRNYFSSLKKEADSQVIKKKVGKKRVTVPHFGLNVLNNNTQVHTKNVA